MAEPGNVFSYDYLPTLADVKVGVDLGVVGSPGRALRTVLMLFVFPTIAISFVLGSAIQGAVWGFAWGIMFAFAFREWLARYILRRQQASGIVHITVDATGVSRSASGRSSHVTWEAVSSVREFDRFYLLTYGAKPVGSVEKGELSESELNELRELIESRKPVSRRGVWSGVA